MTTFSSSANVLKSYPEKNPFKMNIHNLSPEPHYITNRDTPELLREAFSIATATGGHNVFSVMYGSNPLPVDAEAVKDACKPVHLPESPLELPSLTLPASILLLDEVVLDTVPAFTVTADCWDAPRLLKVYPFDERNGRLESLILRQYHNEVDAYAYLLHYGACASEVVPMCFGRVTLSTSQVAQILAMPSLAPRTRTVLQRANSFGALLLEHIPNGQLFTIDNFNNDLADRALQALHGVHTSYVCHGALSCMNVLFVERTFPPLPTDPCSTVEEAVKWGDLRLEQERRKIRVVWFNFDNASCPATTSLSNLDLFNELQKGWEFFYRKLLPAKRIGYTEAFSS